MMRINQLVFIRNLVIDKRLTDYNANIISMKARSIIEMFDLDNYDTTDL